MWKGASFQGDMSGYMPTVPAKGEIHTEICSAHMAEMHAYSDVLPFSATISTLQEVLCSWLSI